jgi:ATP-dependent exoDNAse (exonuclease V) alpha subunit
MLPDDLEFNEQFDEAFRTIDDTDQNVFVTGRAGTGKSTLLEYVRQNTGKDIAFLAPTGVAAVNIRGQTIHSFFGFRPDITVQKVREEFQDRDRDGLFEELEAILIDEISMVRADLMDCMDEFLRMHGPQPDQPFGGIQMIFIGDLYQLPPVVTSDEKKHFESMYDSPYFFDSRVFDEMDVKLVELQKVYRQTDGDFIELLNAVRKRTLTDEHLEQLNERLDPDFEPDPDEMYVHLTPTNSKASEINRRQLSRLSGNTYTFHGNRSGDFDEGALPTAQTLELKEEAQVMMVNNDSQGRWVNGTIGRVQSFDPEEEQIRVELETGGCVDVEPYSWEMYEFSYDEQQNALVSEVVGSFKQYPMTLAWAVTIHKSQGKTYDRVVIDYDRGMFAHGQTYVALSRCTSLDGLVLKKPIEEKHVFTDWRIQKFLTDYRYARANREMPVEEKKERIRAAIKNDHDLHLVYLKSDDTRSERRITPEQVGEMEYRGHPFEGVEGYCHKREAERVFNLEKILQLTVAADEQSSS